MYEEYVDRQGEVVTGIVQQAGDRNNVLVDLGRVEALLPRSEQVDGERYEQGSRIKAVIAEVRSGTKGPQVILSRRDPELIRALFELEVPEIADGLVEIRGVAREPGYRSKIAVESHMQGVDPVGACVGPAGRACAWSSPSSAARRSTSSRGTPSRRASSRRRSRRRACARCTSTTRRAKRRSSSPTTSSRSPSARKGSTPAWRRVSPAGRSTSSRSREFAQAEAEAAFAGATGRRGVLRSLRRDPLEREALPERGASGIALLRRPGPPGAASAD